MMIELHLSINWKGERRIGKTIGVVNDWTGR